jgi:hypothetical protein
MKIVIEVDDNQADAVRQFNADLARKGKPTKGIPSISLTVNNCRTVSVLSCRHSSIRIEGVPETIEAGTIVKVSQSGNWGVVTGVARDGTLTVKASRETRYEIGHATFSTHAGDVEVLV